MELASRIRTKASEIVLQLARELVSTSDATLFGDTEFELRDRAMKMVGVAYSEHLAQKKTGSSDYCVLCQVERVDPQFEEFLVAEAGRLDSGGF